MLVDSPHKKIIKHIPGTTTKQLANTSLPSAQQVLDIQLKKSEWGIPEYKARPALGVKYTKDGAREQYDQHPSETHLMPVNKRIFFTDQAIKDNEWVNGPAHDAMNDPTKPYTYFNALSWANNPTNKTPRFNRNARLSIAGEIEQKCKTIEKTTPGPCRYDNHKDKLKHLPKTIGNYTYK
jgi:hypothetical protein